MGDDDKKDDAAASGEGGDAAAADATAGEGEDKKEKKSFLSSLNPFAKDEVDPKELKKKKEMAEQKKKEEEEAKKKKEDLEKKKQERAEAEETARQAAKRERYQQLLQKNPDPTRRVFQFHMKAMKLDYLAPDPSPGLFLKITLGGNYQEREEPGKGLVKRGRKGPVFKTPPAPKLSSEDVHYFRNEFGAGIPVYWMGSYVDLEMQEFQLELMQSFSLKRTRRRAAHSLTLSQLAQGSVILEINLKDEKATGDKAAAIFARLSFVCYFQELFVFQLRFVSWRGMGLRASDAPKKKARVLLEEDKEELKRKKAQEKLDARQKRLEAAKAKRERRQQERIDAQRAAVAGGSKGLAEAKSRNGTGSTGGAPAADGETGEGGTELAATSGAPARAGDSDQTSLLPGGETSDGKDNKGKSRRGVRGILRRGSSSGGEGGSRKKKKKKLTFAERVEAQNEKDAALKKKKHDAEMRRLRNLKDIQDKREADRLRKADEERKKKEYDPEIFEEATSDPYIRFSIDPPTNPGCKVLRNGGYFGRSVRTDMVTNTLNPSFEEARKPLAYLGTRAELENEMLRVRVYDWDFFSADDLIGQADVPLNGLLEYGQVEVELTLDLPDTTQRKVRGKHPKKTEPAGRLVGQILFEGRLPAYNQLGGGLIERKPGVTYLAVRLESASKLMAADPNGSSDPFATVDWDGMQQTSKVIWRTLEPTWNQTLYFPLKLVTLNKQALASKPAVSIRVFDMDEAGHDLLGSCEIPLHRLTSAEHAKIDDEVGANGRVHKGRVLKLPNQPLILPGDKIQSTINIQLYFAPDLPADIMLEEHAERQQTALSDEYKARLQSYYAQLPGRIRTQLEQAILLEMGKGQDYELGWDSHKRLVCAEDQDAIEHFFCEYLSPQQPPSEMRDARQVARMVRCVTWASDTEIFQKGNRRDVWQSPTFFLEMRKGDSEDHALLMCNLFLGLGLDAYVCVGRLKDQSENDKRHVWVMTREVDGHVFMWETTQGTYVPMSNRWQGKQLSAAEKAALAAQTALVTEGKEKASGGLFGRRKKKGGAADAAEGPADGAEAAEDPAAADSMLVDLEEAQVVGGADAHLLASAEEMLGQFADDDLLTRVEVEESITEVLWMADDPDDEAGASARSLDAQRRQEQEQLDALRRSADAEIELTEEDLKEQLGNMEPCPSLLYDSIEAIFNHKNLWMSRTTLDPSIINYDFEEPKFWQAFIDPRMASQGLPKAFYAPKRLGTKTPPDRLRSMEAQIEGELITQLKLARSSGLTTIVNKSTELVEALKRGLDLQERSAKGDGQAKADLGPWRRDVQGRLPAGSTFKARAFHFAYTDAKKIRKSLLAQCDYAEETGDGTEFTLAVKVFGFHGGICSVWVFYGLIDTNLLG